MALVDEPRPAPPVTPARMLEAMDRLFVRVASRLYGYSRPNTPQREFDDATVQLLHGFGRQVRSAVDEAQMLKKAFIEIHTILKEDPRFDRRAVDGVASMAADGQIAVRGVPPGTLAARKVGDAAGTP